LIWRDDTHAGLGGDDRDTAGDHVHDDDLGLGLWPVAFDGKK